MSRVRIQNVRQQRKPVERSRVNASDKIRDLVETAQELVKAEEHRSKQLPPVAVGLTVHIEYCIGNHRLDEVHHVVNFRGGYLVASPSLAYTQLIS